MSNLVRFGVSIDEKLLIKFDELIEQKGYANRSEALRDLIRDSLIQNELKDDEAETIGTINIIYNHHTRQIDKKKTAKEHMHFHQIISTMHVHLDHDHCLEVSAIRGKAKDVRKIADEIIGMKGVMHGKLMATTTGENLK